MSNGKMATIPNFEEDKAVGMTLKGVSTGSKCCLILGKCGVDPGQLDAPCFPRLRHNLLTPFHRKISHLTQFGELWHIM